MNLKDINTETKEGKLLVAALGMLTSSPEVTANGRKINGRKTTPDAILEEVSKLAGKVYPTANFSE